MMVSRVVDFLFDQTEACKAIAMGGLSKRSSVRLIKCFCFRCSAEVSALALARASVRMAVCLNSKRFESGGTAHSLCINAHACFYLIETAIFGRSIVNTRRNMDQFAPKVGIASAKAHVVSAQQRDQCPNSAQLYLG
jgi:hypothetical protein